MKKTLALLLALMMAMSALAGCGAPADDAAAPAEKTDTNTVAVGAVVIARDDVPEADIYALVSTIYDNVDAITEQHAKGAELDLEFASSITSVPYHPGAARYYSEQGIEVASVKEGAGTGESAAINFGTGGESGTYYGFGGVLASYVSSNTDLSVTAVVSGGSQANLEDIVAGNVQIAFAQSDVMSYAYNGERLFEEKLEGFSTVAALYMEQVQIVSTDASIQSVADLAGKSVSIGAVGSGVYFNAIDVLGAYGLTEEDIKPVYQSFGDSADSLKDGKIDAAFIVAGAPTTAIVDLAASNDVYLVGLGEAEIEALLESSPYYSSYVIPADMY